MSGSADAPNAEGTTRRSVVIGAAAGIGGATVSGLARPTPALASTMTGIINAKDAPYGAVGDGVANDTAALQAAMDAADNAGGQLFIPPGTYLVSGALLTVNASKLRMTGAGADSTIIKVSSANAAEAMITASAKSDIHISDLTLNASSVVNCQRGFYAPGSVARKSIVLERVRVTNVIDPATSTPATWRGIDISPAVGPIRIVDCEVSNCGRGIFLTDSGSDVVVRGCLVEGGAAAKSTNGIELFSGTSADRPILIEGCTVKGMQFDQGGVGSNGDGIRVSNHQGVRAVGNEVSDCHTQGILFGSGTYGSKAIGNDVRDCNNSSSGIRSHGIFLETNPSGDNTFGTDAFRGLVAVGNSIRNCERGIGVSYAAGSVVEGNNIQYCDEEGITCDSHRAQIASNFVLNCWQGGEVASHPYIGGATAPGIAVYSEPAIVRGNVVVDNQTTKTMDEGIALSDDSHVCANNVVLGIATPIFKASDGSQLHMSGNVVREDGNSRMQTIASAATLAPADDADFLLVTGTTQISNIADTWHARTLTLKFASALTVTHGAAGINLAAGTNFSATAGDTLSLIHDGSAWHEVARTVI